MGIPITYGQIFCSTSLSTDCYTSYMSYHVVYHQNSSYCVSADATKSLQSCPTLCDPTDGSPPGSPVPGILQARILDWVAISFSNAWKWKVKVKSLSRVRLLATPWTAAYQAPPSMGFARQGYWSGVPLPSPPREARYSHIVVWCGILFSSELWDLENILIFHGLERVRFL